MRFTILAGLSVLFPLLVTSSTPTYSPMLGATNLPNPFHRPSFDEHLHPPPAPPAEKNLEKRQAGSSNFILHMCRDAAQNDCNPVWVAATQYCFDNFHWFGWTGGTLLSAKVEGTMCCTFYTDVTCNKAGSYVGWAAQICQEDEGQALTIPGGVTAFMCNVPYGSANVHMASSPPEVSPIPTQAAGGPEVANQN